ncbi:maleylpyruvate isomerase N-terminal domain-containing protein [Mycolicibacterium sp. P9-22]|uniref:maleylpyruvate isomerase N-terminal domain-containing protein n=1 Tax=Mycolicibacterium sp. P9-22 TaxID=2024613 RepID=UPI001D14745F|nr:maleylpyruvate isomerase N-terminal domain-containing protein [Mycolicibacterium sp. P9-22]
MQTVDARLTSRIYLDTKERICALLPGADHPSWAISVPACPGWTVRDVVAHMTAVAQDWADGTLSGAPTDEQTAEHVARFADRNTAHLLEAWTAATARLQQMAATDGLSPPLGDIACHEHDIRGALDRAGARESAAVWHTSDRLIPMLQPSRPVRITVEDGEYLCGPAEGTEIGLTTTRFEALRWRTGRRSRAQLAAMNWSGDPAPIIEELYLFGPTLVDLVE